MLYWHNAIPLHIANRTIKYKHFTDIKWQTFKHFMYKVHLFLSSESTLFHFLLLLNVLYK